MSSLSAVSNAMNDVYENLIRLVDIHIERLVHLEDALDAELQMTEASTLPVPSYHEPLLFDSDETASESSDDPDTYEPIIYDDDREVDGAVMSLSQLGLGNHVNFSDTVFEIGSPTRFTDSSIRSDRTVPMNFTPFDRRLVSRIHSSDSDSDASTDSDTIILEWSDPFESPSRYMVFDYEDDDDYAIL